MSEWLSGVRRDADALPPILDKLASALEGCAVRCDLAWLRSLLVLSAEIQFTLTRPPPLNRVALVDELRELHELLARPSSEPGDPEERYVAARAESGTLRALHEEVLATCAALTELEGATWTHALSSAAGHAVSPIDDV
jgi:hypothetical protein